MKKKIFAVILIGILVLTAFTGCSFISGFKEGFSAGQEITKNLSEESKHEITTPADKLLVDDAHIFSLNNDYITVQNKLKEASDETGIAIVVLTTDNGFDETEIQTYAENYRVNNIQEPFMILTIDMDSRKVDVYYADYYFWYDAGEKIRENVTFYLKQGKYTKAVDKLIDGVKSYKHDQE